MRSRASEIFPSSARTVRQAIIEVFRIQGWGYNPAKSADNVLVAKIGADLLSFGETVEVRLIELPEAQVQVLAESRTNWQMVDYGKTKRQIKQLFACLERELRKDGDDRIKQIIEQRESSPLPAALRKSDNYQFCVHCGSPVSYGNRFCTRCGKPI